MQIIELWEVPSDTTGTFSDHEHMVRVLFNEHEVLLDDADTAAPQLISLHEFAANVLGPYALTPQQFESRCAVAPVQEQPVVDTSSI
jgi:hypothetical protein